MNNPSWNAVHAGVSENQTRGSPTNSDRDCMMDVSPVNERCTSDARLPPGVNDPTCTFLESGADASSNGFAAWRTTEFVRSQPFGEPFGPVVLERAGSGMPPSTPGPLSGFGFGAVDGTATPSGSGMNLGTDPATEFLELHFGGLDPRSCFGAPGSFASGAGVNCVPAVPPPANCAPAVPPPYPPPVIAGPSSFPLEVPFGAGAHQSDPTQYNRSHSNPNQFYQSGSNSNSLNQSNPNPTSFNQSTPNRFNQSNPASFNQSTPTSFNQSTPNRFNQSTPSQFNQSTPTSFNQSTPNRSNQSTPSQLNSLATSSPFSTPVPNTSSASSKSPNFNIGAAPPVQRNKFGRPVKKFPHRNRKGKGRAISKDDPIIIDQDLDIIEEEFAMMDEDP